jgi:hypothetical protein
MQRQQWSTGREGNGPAWPVASRQGGFWLAFKGDPLPLQVMSPASWGEARIAAGVLVSVNEAELSWHLGLLVVGVIMCLTTDLSWNH